MLTNTGDQMDTPILAEKAKKQNIIDMAVGFTAMMPLFQESSTVSAGPVFRFLYQLPTTLGRLMSPSCKR